MNTVKQKVPPINLKEGTETAEEINKRRIKTVNSTTTDQNTILVTDKREHEVTI